MIELDEERLDTLVDACTRHDKGELSDDPTVGVCWDADRLNLWRVGIRPDPHLLCTPAARDPAPILEAGSFHGRSYRWDELFAGYARILSV